MTDVAIGLHGEWNEKLKDAIKSVDSQSNGWCKIDMGLTYQVKKRNQITSSMSTLTSLVTEAAKVS